MSDYPDTIYSGRVRSNKAGFPFDPDKSDVLYAEDADAWDNEITAIEEDLTAKNSFHEIFIAPYASGSITLISQQISDGVDYPDYNPDYPRQLSIMVTNYSFEVPLTATMTIEGLDQDGNEISEIIVISMPSPGTSEDFTDHAFLIITQITISDASGLGVYTITITNKFGVRHYPFLSADKFYSYTIDNINTIMPALDLTNGLITLPADEIKNFGLWYKK